MNFLSDDMKTVSANYAGMFGECLEAERLAELEGYLFECESLDDLEALADGEDGTISFGEYEAMLSIATGTYGLEYKKTTEA